MPSSKGHATKGGGARSKKTSSPQNTQPRPTGIWQQSLIPKPSQNFSLCEPGKYLEYGDEMRLQCEALFCMPVNIKLFNSWQRSEEHWYRKDREMLEYLQDFALKDWLIPLAQANAAYEAMQERFRLRDEGKSIYTHGIPLYDPYDELELCSSKAGETEAETTEDSPAKLDHESKLREVESPSKPHDEQPTRRQHRDSAVVTDVQEPESPNGTSPKFSWRKLADISKEKQQSAVFQSVPPQLHAGGRSKSENATTKVETTSPKCRKSSIAVTDTSEANDCSQTCETLPEEPMPILKYQSDSPTKPTIPSGSRFVPINPLIPVEAIPVARKRKAQSISEDQVIRHNEPKHTEDACAHSQGGQSEPPSKKAMLDKRTISPDTDHQRRKLISKLSKTAIIAPPYDRDPAIPQRLPNFDFPWQNDWAGEDPEEWDDSIYDSARLEHIKHIHMINSNVVTRYMENGKHGAQKRKSAAMLDIKLEPDTPESLATEEAMLTAQAATKTNKRRPKVKRTRGSDPREHFSGRLHFADETQEAKFNALPYFSIEDAIKAAMENPFDEALKDIEVAHDPGDSLLDNLQLPRVSIMDIARTRLQLHHIRVFTDRAAECLIDFCPDLLTNYHLLQVVSETRFSNTQVQIRLGHNGSMLSDSTITKRVSAALNREYDKRGAAEAACKDPEFKKTNRDMYAKYKAWRAQKRLSGVQQKYSQFILIESARLHKEQQHPCPSEDSQPSKRRSSLRPIEPAATATEHTSSDSTLNGSAEYCALPKPDIVRTGPSGTPSVATQTERATPVDGNSAKPSAAKQVMIPSPMVSLPAMSYPVTNAEASKALPSAVDNIQSRPLARYNSGNYPAPILLEPPVAPFQVMHRVQSQKDDEQQQISKMARAEGQRSIHEFFMERDRTE